MGYMGLGFRIHMGFRIWAYYPKNEESNGRRTENEMNTGDVVRIEMIKA